MAQRNTVRRLLDKAENDAPAISAPDRSPLTYQVLRGFVDDTVATLNRFGIGRGDTAAIVLPNGPEMATAFIAVAAGATTAPLNPGYREDEFAFYLDDLGAKAIILPAGYDGPALTVAERLGLVALMLTPTEAGPAGHFSLATIGEATAAAAPGPAEADDIALVLHTSGTTSRPKIVPLSQANLTASAGHIAATLHLGATDRCLNIMPLFHIHGLIAAVLSSLGAGASVCCTPGFNALRFFTWMAKAKPTWYTAVPTMHQAILSRAAKNQEIIQATPLRFIRSSSSSLPPQVMQQLEAVFDVPVIESYGMTEATHQMASNPLPPAPRKPGSVGIAAGPEIAVIDDDYHPLPPGGVGEIAIRGTNVTKGYVNNAKANRETFTDGWFRTGDQGFFDADSYLTISGRLEEIINRGGEKISPREVEEVLLDHPAVAQAVTFAVRHDKLGEDVAAAIVLSEQAAADARAIREFAAGRLADFKVPRQVLFVDEIPKGPTGKLQRIGLAKLLGLEQ